VYFEGDQGRDVRVADIPADMIEAAEEHRMQVGASRWNSRSRLVCVSTDVHAFLVQLIETLADYDEDVAEAFLAEEEIDGDSLKQGIRRATLGLEFSPGPHSHLPKCSFARTLTRGTAVQFSWGLR